MKKLIFSGLMTLLCASFGLAQNTTSDYKKSEFFVGYSNNQVDTGLNSDSGNQFQNFFNDRESFHGVNVTGTYNVSRYVGITGDVSGTYNNKNFSITVPTGTTTTGTVSFKTKNSLYNFLGGVQVKDNSSDSRIKPFGYALVGAGHARTKFKDVSCPTGVDCTFFNETDSETGLAGAFGGGLDIKINDKIDFRAIKVDYNPIKLSDGVNHNVRIGVGIVF
ncbi:MAG TPA: outer membrane beta-barrel protein [Pyrinomonadaceae bacterium]|nr:outer membrane beta-barrel protein [Pyrinomonadaceae bacterium]